MSKPWSWRRWLLWSSLSLILLPGALGAQDDDPLIQYRQKLMSANGAHMGSIGDILKNKLPLSPSHIAIHARAISETSKLIGPAFEKKITEGKTDAKAEIWQDWDKFLAAAKSLEEESARLAELAEKGDMQGVLPQVRKVGDACSGCHEPFRKPREESYKR